MAESNPLREFASDSPVCYVSRMDDVSSLIRRYDLAPLPEEGGYFRQFWASDVLLADGRPCGTAIWFLVTATGFSALHRLDADEVWHFHQGEPLMHVQLHPDGKVTQHLLGTGECSSALVVRRGVWQGTRLASANPDGWSLVSCTMAPGWSQNGFQLGSREDLIRSYPLHGEEITALTRR
jgi:uncharacterized protein